MNHDDYAYVNKTAPKGYGPTPADGSLASLDYPRVEARVCAATAQACGQLNTQAQVAPPPLQSSYAAALDTVKGQVEKSMDGAYYMGREDERKTQDANGEALRRRLSAIVSKLRGIHNLFFANQPHGDDFALNTIDKLNRLAASTFEKKPATHAVLFWGVFTDAVRRYGPLGDKQELGRVDDNESKVREHFYQRMKQLLLKEAAYDKLIEANKLLQSKVQLSK